MLRSYIIHSIHIVVREQSMRPDLIEAMLYCMYYFLGEESKVSLHYAQEEHRISAIHLDLERFC